jgi:hypothetical protein
LKQKSALQMKIFQETIKSEESSELTEEEIP